MCDSCWGKRPAEKVAAAGRGRSLIEMEPDAGNGSYYEHAMTYADREE
jgi:hypothetical protein